MLGWICLNNRRMSIPRLDRISFILCGVAVAVRVITTFA